jgi:hypothetical protein
MRYSKLMPALFGMAVLLLVGSRLAQLDALDSVGDAANALRDALALVEPVPAADRGLRHSARWSPDSPA